MCSLLGWRAQVKTDYGFSWCWTCARRLRRSEIGERHAFTLTGWPRFLVRDALHYWRDFTGDEAKLALLERYVAAAQEGRLSNPTLTLAPDASGLRLVDGNKRAIALYEARAATRYPVRVFVLQSPQT
jgi:hypothetical protein